MSTAPPDILAELTRLKKRQQQQGVITAICFLLLVGALGFLLFARPKSEAQDSPAEAVSAQRFDLLTSQGQKLAMLSKGRQGPMLTMSEGKARAELNLRSHGPALILADGTGKLASLGTNEKASELRLIDQRGKIRAALTVDADASGLSLFDDADKPRIKMSVRSDGPHLEFLDASGKVTSVKP